MKAIILISSIFYFIGLKIAEKVNLIQVKNPVEKIITKTITPVTSGKSYFFNGEKEKENTTDSLKENSISKDQLKNFK